MPTTEELRKFKDLANRGRIPDGGGKIVADMLRQIEEAEKHTSAWSDHHVWPVYSKNNSLRKSKD